jgi:acylglycerol lipase
VLADIRSFLNHISSSPSTLTGGDLETVPLFLMGHSMGGAEVLLLSLLESSSEPLPLLSGILLEAPYIALHPSAQPGAFTVMAGKLASKVLPKRQLVQKLDSKNLSRNPQVCRDWEADELCHDTGTLEGLSGMLQRAADLSTIGNDQTVKGIGLKTVIGSEKQGSASIPVWLGHGTEDRVTSCRASQKIFEKLDVEDKTIKLYKGAYHKLHAEPNGVAEEFANDVATWILDRTGTETQNDVDRMKPRL